MHGMGVNTDPSRSLKGSEETGIVRTPILNGLGQALRWLRDRRGRKQYEVAETAGITKGMLSAYETGRQRPSLETLEKILGTLGCDLNDLHNAIQIINGRPEGMRRRGEGAGSEETAPAPAGAALASDRLDVQRILGRRQALPPEEERAMSEMLDGFHRFLRYLHDTLARALRPDKPDDKPGDEPDGKGEK
jgi:transcriptional regulator with XRE-family HTH domain